MQPQQSVADLAAARLDTEDYDIDNADEWEPIGSQTFYTGSFTPESVQTSGDGTVAGWLLEDEDLDERTLEVFYDTGGVHIAIEGSGEAVFGSTGCEFPPQLAKQVAAAMYQAAIEQERRSEGTDGDD
ncbi:hypothetical protein SAMN05216226_1313 [Halovenus aranensis]|uniref:Uncharacterized protein n=1 Tax=Halovenus aranensis TaxID=890420 RepID=A0A1G8ZQA5_9EURY|nr:hypothetical protein [Halovenus aranensis]SDK17231.1 hypothetical protein SAMN05216226_1313 [Halovenus aranensis]